MVCYIPLFSWPLEVNTSLCQVTEFLFFKPGKSGHSVTQPQSNSTLNQDCGAAATTGRAKVWFQPPDSIFSWKIMYLFLYDSK